MKVHDEVPGITENVLVSGSTDEGCSSYKILADSIPILNDKTVVDLACGSGCLTELLAARTGAKGLVVGIDLNRRELELAQQRMGGIQHVRFLNESACKISLESGSADAVLCHMAMMLFQPVDIAISEIARILRHGGVFASVLPTLNGGNASFSALRKSLSEILSRDVPAERMIPLGNANSGSENGIRKLLSENGSFADDYHSVDFDVVFEDTPETLAKKFIPFFYYTHLLSDHGKEELLGKWSAILRGCEQKAGKAVFRLPLSVFTVTRR